MLHTGCKYKHIQRQNDNTKKSKVNLHWLLHRYNDNEADNAAHSVKIINIVFNQGFLDLITTSKGIVSYKQQFHGTTRSHSGIV